MKRTRGQTHSLSEAEFSGAITKALPELIAMARRLSANDDLASEAIQNALLKASRSYQTFQGRSHVKTWLTRIVIHCVRDVLAADSKRKSRFHSASGDKQDVAHFDPVDQRRGPRDQTIANERRSVVQQAVLRLPDRQREVIGLVVWQGMSAKQAAELLEIDSQAVHANLHAARKRLKDLLREFAEDDFQTNDGEAK